MRSLLRLYLVVVAALCALALPARADAQEPTLVVLVRHAEKAAAGGRDPELSEAGTARAAALAEALAGTPVDVVVTTQLQRTRLTAAPLLRKHALTPEVVPTGSATDAHVRAVADAVRRHAGKTVLVVGHSNTVPAIVGALGGPALGELCEHEYSNLYVMVLRPDAAPSLVRSRFGDPDPEATDPCPVPPSR
jgi:broad specificity phosphatase PhoE